MLDTKAPSSFCEHHVYKPADLRDLPGSPYCSACRSLGLAEGIDRYPSPLPQLSESQQATARRVARSFTIPGYSVEDLTQETLLAATEVISRNPNAGNGLIAKAAEHRLQNLKRGEFALKRGGAFTLVSLSAQSADCDDDASYELEIASTDPSPEDCAAANEMWNLIAGILPDEQFRVLELSVSDYTITEIADLLGINRKTAARYLRSATSRLQESLYAAL